MSDRTASLSFERPSNCTKNCVQVNFPSIPVHCNPGLIQVVINLFMLLDAHRVDGCEIHRMSIFLKTFASRNQPRLNDGVQVVSVSNVKMYSMKSSGNSTLSCNVGSTRAPPEWP